MIELGQKVKDTVSGFIGIAVARHIYFQGCERITVQPSVDKDGKLPDTATFDEPDLIAIEEKKLKGKNDTGGPEKFSDVRRY